MRAGKASESTPAKVRTPRRPRHRRARGFTAEIAERRGNRFTAEIAEIAEDGRTAEDAEIAEGDPRAGKEEVFPSIRGRPGLDHQRKPGSRNGFRRARPAPPRKTRNDAETPFAAEDAERAETRFTAEDAEIAEDGRTAEDAEDAESDPSAGKEEMVLVETATSRS